MKKLSLLVVFPIFILINFINAQITAPGSVGSFQTNYSSAFLSGGGTNDNVFVFCGNHNQENIGVLTINAPGCSIEWYRYDGNSFIPIGVTTSTASGLSSGLYMVSTNCGGVKNCYRAWVWVNRSFIDVNPIPPGCQTFDLTANINPLDTEFIINDPPGMNFVVDENTYIKVCFWANHTYVSDLGFYLKAPGFQNNEPGSPGVVQLCPAASDWGPNATHGSWTGIPWSALGCSNPNDENTVCNSGDNVGNAQNGFCFQTHSVPGGMPIPAGTPALTPCVCDMPTPLVGNFASVGPWNTIFGSLAGQAGWSVQIYDCEPVDVGALTRATITFIGQTDCGQATFTYDSGTINSAINDNSCSASTASLYVVPPQTPPGTYTVTSSITSYQWTSNPPGYTSNQLNNTIYQGSPEFPTSNTEYILTAIETINVPGNISCSNSGSQTLLTLPADATITPINPLCTNANPITLEASHAGGTWSCTTVPNAVQNGIFYPNIAGPGTHTIVYTITGPCEDQDQINVVVFETINIQNFANYVCAGDNLSYFVTFDVVNSQGDPTSFRVNTGTGSVPYFGSYAGNFLSGAMYNITVTDVNNCQQFVFSGSRDCNCETFAGTMANLNPLILCQNECSSAITHNENQFTETNDVFEFALHTGGYPANILVRKNTPNFCFNDIPNGQYGTTYYVSAICGDNDGTGHVDQSDPCYSQSPPVPVIWLSNPIAHISETELATCGLSIDINATPPDPGMIGVWTANSNFFTTGGTSINSPDVSVLVQNYGDVMFTWTVINGMCQASDSILVHFYQTPSAYAGEDITVCGNEAQLNAVYSLPGTSGFWYGPGSFESQSSPNTLVTSSFGTQIFTWREIIGPCWSEDNIAVTFVQSPNPVIPMPHDSVCDVTYNLHVYNSTNPGYWTAYTGDPLTPMVPAPFYIPSNTNPNANVTISNFSGLIKPVTFVWTETAQIGTLQCTSEVSIEVVFAKMPHASVGPVNEAEICGNTFDLTADTLGSGWANGLWVAGKNIICSFENQNSPNTSVTLTSPGVFGDSAYVRVPFIWTMKNPAGGCTTVDTMWVTFYRRPQANAGLDNAVCGNNYTLGAVYSLPNSNNYIPSGLWSVFSRPNVNPTPSANFDNLNNDTTNVIVSHVGFWEFLFRENNTYLSSCYSIDTVKIEFVEIPIISAGLDKNVCGNCTQLEATTAGYSMSWVDNGADYSDYSIPNPTVCVNVYGPREFVMIETNMSQPPFTLACQSKDTVIITFWRVPSANILTDEADSTVCGLTFPRLRAENPGTGIRGYWSTNNPFTEFYPDANTWNNASATVPSYGYHDFYWIEETGPEDMPGFCTDTAGPLRIHFIQIPTANAGNDTLFCGFSGTLNAIPSIGTGVWSTPSTQNISFNNPSSPNAIVTSNILNAGNPANPFFLLIWTEDNTNGCTDKDTIKVQFARIPSSDVIIIPPKCFGEEATIRAVEDTLQQYTWNFFNGQIVQSFTNSQGGNHRNFVRWNDGTDFHVFNLITTNYWGCNSPIAIDTVYEPPIPEFDVNIIKDTCALGKGGLIFNEDSPTTAFFWIYDTIGPAPGPITQVLNIPAGDYGIRTSYLTPNTQYISHYLSTFGTQYCIDTFYYTIQTVGMIDAQMEIAASVDLENLVAPNAVVTFLNNSIYDDVRKRCEWNFGDGTKLKNCDPMVEHTYTKSGCYEPFLIVMNRDLPECRDTARLSACIQVDDESMIEVPNIFSPNGDGINDFFQVKARTLKTFTGQIVNRYGRVVYTWENWQDYEAGWDGNLEGGSKAAPGVYYYIIKATGWDDKDYNLQGVLHLMRD